MLVVKAVCLEECSSQDTGPDWRFWDLKANPLVTYFLQPSHIYSNKATHLLKAPPPKDIWGGAITDQYKPRLKGQWVWWINCEKGRNSRKRLALVWVRILGWALLTEVPREQLCYCRHTAEAHSWVSISANETGKLAVLQVQAQTTLGCMITLNSHWTPLCVAY